jgi:proline iminopeptidase
MDFFDSPDGTRLVHHGTGGARPLICVPGGPMEASAYLGDLGGLTTQHSLVLLDLRGTGSSAIPADPASYRCDRQVQDIEALRAHLGLERIDLLAHSAGAAVAVLYAAAHPERVDRLVLINPSPRVVGLEVTDLDRREVADQRRDEPWYPDASAALSRIAAGDPAESDWEAVAPFVYGRWNADIQSFAAEAPTRRNAQAAAAYYGAGAFEPAAVRAALTHLTAPVLLVSGEFDIQLPPRWAGEYAGLFPRAELAVLPGGAHFAWLDDPDWLVRTVTDFLR